MKFRLRTLLILLAVAPPLLARAWFTKEQTVAAFQRTTFENWVCLVMVVVGIALSVRAIRQSASALT